MATVFVGGINRKATPALLLKFFEDNFGSTSDCKIIMDRDTGSSKGYGFVTFKTEKAAKHVVSNGFVFFMGKRMQVGMAKAQQKGRGASSAPSRTPSGNGRQRQNQRRRNTKTNEKEAEAPDLEQKTTRQDLALKHKREENRRALRFRESAWQATSLFARPMTTKEIRLPTASMGAVIGRGGATIKSLMQDSGARIQIHTPDTHEGVDPLAAERGVTLFGSAAAVELAERLIQRQVGSAMSADRQAAASKPAVYSAIATPLPTNNTAWPPLSVDTAVASPYIPTHLPVPEALSENSTGTQRYVYRRQPLPVPVTNCVLPPFNISRGP